MGFNVASLKRSRADQLTEVAKAIADSESKGYSKDERYWQPEADKSGRGEAVVRFLPKIDDSEKRPFVELYTHSFKHGERWYIENSRTTMEGENDPCAEEFWRIRTKTPTEETKAKAAKFSRKLNYISNVLVVDDPVHPENNGKVFLFKYGKVIFDMLKDALEPEFAGQEPINAFDLIDGANFHIRFYKKDGFRKYDKSTFEAAGPLAATEKELLKLLDGKGWSLAAEVASNKFKSYEELRKKFNSVMGRGDEAQAAGPKAKTESEETPPWDDEPAVKPAAQKVTSKSLDDDEDAFSSMADDD